MKNTVKAGGTQTQIDDGGRIGGKMNGWMENECGGFGWLFLWFCCLFCTSPGIHSSTGIHVFVLTISSPLAPPLIRFPPLSYTKSIYAFYAPFPQIGQNTTNLQSSFGPSLAFFLFLSSRHHPSIQFCLRGNGRQNFPPKKFHLPFELLYPNDHQQRPNLAFFTAVLGKLFIKY